MTTVGPTWAAEMVTVNGVVAPSVSWLAGGVSETTVGKAGVTVIWLVALVPLSVAVMSAWPAVFAATVKGALSCPAGTVTVAGTAAILPAELLRATTVFVA